MPGAREGSNNSNSATSKLPEQNLFSESLILAQNERWQRGLGMQVERDREGSNIGP